MYDKCEMQKGVKISR